jgi:hypothetical protein
MRRLDIRAALANVPLLISQETPMLDARDGSRVPDFTTTIAGPRCMRPHAGLGGMRDPARRKPAFLAQAGGDIRAGAPGAPAGDAGGGQDLVPNVAAGG